MNSPVVSFAGKGGDSTEISGLTELFTPLFYAGAVEVQAKSAIDSKLFFDDERQMAKNWIAGATSKHKGALRRELKVPAGKRIPASKLRAAAAKGGTLGRRARLAQTLSRLRK